MATTAAQTKRYTIDDLERFPEDGKRRELVDGRVVEWDLPTFEHGCFLMMLGRILSLFTLQHRLGVVVAGDAMVSILGSEYDARGADIAFYARGRIPRDQRAAETAVTPDFVIEIISPSDRASEVQLKVRDWLRAGVKLLWYIDPVSGSTAVHQGEHTTFVGADDVLSGGDVLPGFSVRLRDIFEEITALTTPEQDAGEPR